MKSSLIILTGASRGLGLAMAQQLASRPSVRLLTLSRATLTSLGTAHEHWDGDLADCAPIALRLTQWLGGINPETISEVSIIHNAALLTDPGMLGLPGPGGLEKRQAQQQAALRVGLEAPLLLTDAFLEATHHWPGKRKVLMISSGLGRFALAGNAPYCAIKAGMDHLARAMALEQVAGTQCPNPAMVVSLAPGVIDTDMQVQLRSADPSVFVNQVRFKVMKEQGQLDTPQQAAAKVLAFLDREDFGSKTIADVREP